MSKQNKLKVTPITSDEQFSSDIETTHQQVREFVQAYITDHDLPLIVTTIEGRSQTRYAPTLATKDYLIPEYILSDVKEEFHVEAFSTSGHTSMRFDVYIYDGKMHMANPTLSRRYP